MSRWFTLGMVSLVSIAAVLGLSGCKKHPAYEEQLYEYQQQQEGEAVRQEAEYKAWEDEVIHESQQQ